MVVQLSDGKVYVVTDMEDVRELVDPELFEAIVELTNNKYDTYEDELEEEIDNLKDDVKGYDNSCYSMRSAISEAVENIERLVNYILEAKKLDRDKLIKELNGISLYLEECEGY